MKFSHMGDCHLGAWRRPELKELNFKSFQQAIEQSIKEKVDFILISGDLFDSPYPPIEILKSTFEEFKKVYDAKIPVFLIAGSHDYSVSGKTFLDVLERAGFCKNVFLSEEKDGKIVLQPTLYKGAAIYGFPGKKSGMEVGEIERIKLQDAPGMFKILMLHTTIKDAVNNPLMDSVDETKLPDVDYLALSHLHIRYVKENRVYSGPTFPNNISELEELGEGSFFIFDNGQIKRETILINEVVPLTLEINDALTASEKIIDYFKNQELRDKIVLVRLLGVLEKGKISDIDFQKIEKFLFSRGAFSVLKNTSKLFVADLEIENNVSDSESLEEEIIESFSKKNSSKFNYLIPSLFNFLKMEKQEDEVGSSFEERLFSESRRILDAS